MKYRLIKSEPYKYSRNQFVSDGKTIRDSVRNYQARNNLNTMSVGDLCFWYHSNEGKEIVGIAKVLKTAFPDPTADDPRWVAVEVCPLRSFSKPVTLEQIKSDPKLASISLIKQQRLSVAPITVEEFEYINTLSK